MIPYEIIVSELAEADVAAIFERLLLRSSDVAVQFRNGIEEAITSLSEMPKRCPVAPDNGRLEYPMRQLIHRHGRTAYRILFAVFDEANDAPAFVRVLRVRHGAQQHLNALSDQTDED